MERCILKLEVSTVEKQLRKRLDYPYKWYLKQNDCFDRRTNFIYRIANFDDVLVQINNICRETPEYHMLSNYALNRWYNFWSARAVEQIFCSLVGVKPAKNLKDRLIDFQIHDIKFDHKTSVFPRQYAKTLDYAKRNQADLIQWLYVNQSQEQRKHVKNRLFIVLHADNADHWKLKAEISWLGELIELYVRDFDPDNLHRFSFERDTITLSDIIWGIK